MRFLRRAMGLLTAVGLLFLAGFGPPAPAPLPPVAEPAKLGFSYLSPEQQKDLWRRADDYALAEVFLKACGSPPYIERRMRMAVRDCIEARALDRVMRAGRYWVPHWYKAAHWIAYWDTFDRPSIKPRYARGAPENWWFDRDRAAKLEKAG